MFPFVPSAKMYETAVYEELWVGKNKKHKRSKKFCSFYFAALQRLLRLKQLNVFFYRKVDSS